MTKHAKQPSLCADCEATAVALAEANPHDRHVLKRCPHNGVVALGLQRGGTIKSWQMEGPLTDVEADALGVRIVAMIAATGMTTRGFTRQ